MMRLKLDDITLQFADKAIFQGLNLHLKPAEIVCVQPAFWMAAQAC